MAAFTVLAVGRLRERHYQAACAEYQKRLAAYGGVELIELPEYRLPERPSEAEIAAGLAREAAAVRGRLPKNVWLCALTPEGKQLSSEQLAELLRRNRLAGRSSACFLLGSSFGMDASLKGQADLLLSLSPMTFPHHLARVMLLEQLYRAESILAGGKYHK